MNKNLIPLIIVMLIFTACSSQFEITKSVNRDNPEIVTWNTPRISVKSEHESQTFYTYIQFSCFKNEDKKTYSISASHVSYEWPLFEKVIFTIDGAEKEFLPDRPPLRDIEGVQGPTETITVQVPEETVMEIYESMETRMQVIGKNFKYTVYFTNDLKMTLYNFYLETN